MAAAGVEYSTSGAIDVNNRRLVHLSHQTLKIEWSSGNPIYVGRAEPGSATADPVWAIQKITYDGSNNPTDVQWASGSIAYKFAWDNRADPSIVYK